MLSQYHSLDRLNRSKFEKLFFSIFLFGFLKSVSQLSPRSHSNVFWDRFLNFLIFQSILKDFRKGIYPVDRNLRLSQVFLSFKFKWMFLIKTWWKIKNLSCVHRTLLLIQSGKSFVYDAKISTYWIWLILFFSADRLKELPRPAESLCSWGWDHLLWSSRSSDRF